MYIFFYRRQRVCCYVWGHFLLLLFMAKTNAPSGVWSELFTGCWSAVDIQKREYFLVTWWPRFTEKTENSKQTFFYDFFFWRGEAHVLELKAGPRTDVGTVRSGPPVDFWGLQWHRNGTVLNALLWCIMWRWCSSMLGRSQGGSMLRGGWYGLKCSVELLKFSVRISSRARL